MCHHVQCVNGSRRGHICLSSKVYTHHKIMTNMDSSHVQQFAASRIGANRTRMPSGRGPPPCMRLLQQVTRALWTPCWLPKQIWPSGIAWWVNIVSQQEPAASYVFCNCKLDSVYVFYYFSSSYFIAVKVHNLHQQCGRGHIYCCVLFSHVGFVYVLVWMYCQSGRQSLAQSCDLYASLPAGLINPLPLLF